MQIGAVIPQFPSEDAPDRYRTFARTVEDLGYHHLLAYDHVLEIPVHEPLTLLSTLAGVTDRVRLVTGILILPQRQTALVAKQAAEVDILSDGRLRLGIGIGWNESEYVALGTTFETRGRRVEEQIQVLRRLWTEKEVDFAGEFHTIPDVGLAPEPVQQPIPLWLGGGADAVLHRIARMGEGWVLPGGSPSELEPQIDRLRSYLAEQDRDPDDIALLARTSLDGDDPDEWVEEATAWHRTGATHLAVDPGETDQPAERLETLASALESSALALGS